MRTAVACALSVAALVVASVATAVPAPIVQAGFSTPSGNIVCNAGPFVNGGSRRLVVDCTVLSETVPDRGQKVWALFGAGRPQVGFIMGDAATDVPTLAYGRTWHWHGVTCTSRSAGLTCANRSHHGFFLSRERQRVF